MKTLNDKIHEYFIDKGLITLDDTNTRTNLAVNPYSILGDYGSEEEIDKALIELVTDKPTIISRFSIVTEPVALAAIRTEQTDKSFTCVLESLNDMAYPMSDAFAKEAYDINKISESYIPINCLQDIRAKEPFYISESDLREISENMTTENQEL